MIVVGQCKVAHGASLINPATIAHLFQRLQRAGRTADDDHVAVH